jgi:TRAP-type uncharacterized transport system fused permease subunit
MSETQNVSSDKFTQVYVLSTIIYAILGLVQVVFFYFNNPLLKFLILALSNIDYIYTVLTILFLIHVIKHNLSSKLHVLTISFIVYVVVFFSIGIVLMMYGVENFKDPFIALNPSNIFSNIVWILSALYYVFQFVFAMHILSVDTEHKSS